MSAEAQVGARIEGRLHALAGKWTGVRPAERSNYQRYLTELCEALGVERSPPAGTGYCFEQPVRVINRDGSESTNFIHLYKQSPVWPWVWNAAGHGFGGDPLPQNDIVLTSPP